MKIEVCEQMISSWLQHIKGCQIVQTNWSPSPVSIIAEEQIESVSSFVSAVKEHLNDTELDVFKKSTIRQIILQCEIDVIGISIIDGGVGDLYLVDSAFHESGLGYKEVVATVMKKILRAMLVSGVVFPGVPANIIFASPKCSPNLIQQITESVENMQSITKQWYPDTSISMLFNEAFTSAVYEPLLDKMPIVNNDNDLFMRCMKLSSVAQSYSATLNERDSHHEISHTSSISRTPRGVNRSIVLDSLNRLILNGLMTRELLMNLCDKEYSNRVFKLPSPFPFLVKNSEFASTGFQDCRFYANTYITVFDEKYRVCSQWIPERIRCLEKWMKSFPTCG